MNELFRHWLARDPDETTRQELHHLIDTNQKGELADRFQGRLVFGTAGLRGKVGCGPNRMNRLVIQETATGLGQYLCQQQPEAKTRGVIVGYDGRLDSKRFAQDTAAALTALGIKVYLTQDVAPTPAVAYGILHFGTAAGVVVTASHNPPEYNGFKVYWDNGAQIIPPHDRGIADAIAQAAQAPLQLMDLTEAKQQGLLVMLDASYADTYRHSILSQPILQPVKTEDSALPDTMRELSIAYTAMHGVGAPYAESMLKTAGFTNIYSVPEQREPDGHFPTVNFPNPEEEGAMDLVIALATAHDADLACANDPDADRFAVAVKVKTGEYKMLTGDQVGVLVADYLLSQQVARTGKADVLVGNTIVSSSLLEQVAAHYQATYYKTLTGFKWLTNVAMARQTEQVPFLFVYEEALGYTMGQQVWDKDGMATLVVFAQLAQALKAKGLTIWDQLATIYRRHGLYVTAQKSIALSESTPPVGETLRANPPTQIAGRDIVMREDYATSQRVFATGHEETIPLPVSDVLVYTLEGRHHTEGRARVIVRPSGTEPKLKCYYELVTEMHADETYWQAQERIDEQVSLLIAEHQIHLFATP